MAHIVAKKSYILIDTPECCGHCPLCIPTDAYRGMRCVPNSEEFIYDEEFKLDNCPLKSIEFEVKFDV